MRAVLAEYSSTVSPGIAGFLVTFGLALATWLLIRSMVGRIRRLRYTPDPAARPEPEQPDPEQRPGQPFFTRPMDRGVNPGKTSFTEDTPA